MNIDTDTQWACWDGMRQYEATNRPYLQTQIGNPEGDDKPNKKYYDPRMPIRASEVSIVDRLCQCFEDLNCKDVLGLPEMGEPTNVMQPEGVRRKGGLPV